jgi:hypothetical protein
MIDMVIGAMPSFSRELSVDYAGSKELYRSHLTSRRPYSPIQFTPRVVFQIAAVEAAADESTSTNSPPGTPLYLKDPRHQFPEELTPIKNP